MNITIAPQALKGPKDDKRVNIKIAPQAPKETKDDKRVYLGGESPSFGPIRKSQ